MVTFNSIEARELIKKGRADTNAVDNSALPRHRWYPIKEGFSANFVSSSYQELAAEPGKKVFSIDPFSGSGTSVVECTKLGVSCDAYEVNPFLAFVAQTKLRQLSKHVLKRERKHVIRGLQQQMKSPLEGISTFTEGGKHEKWLFNRDVLRSFTGGWDKVSACTPKSRALFRLALIRSVMDNCNAYPDGKCLRYKRLPDYDCFDPKSLLHKFEHYCGMMEDDMESMPFDEDLSTVTRADCRTLATLPMVNRFDLCVTSPPYLNSFDYSDVYRPEMFLGGFVKSNEELMQIRLKTLRSHVQANWKSPTRENFGTIYAKVIKDVLARKDEFWSPRIPEMVQAYFEDMEKLIQALERRANDHALLKIAVATSAYGGVVVPVDFILAEIAELNGWELKEVQIIRRLRSSAQHWKHQDHENRVPELRESVVILRRSKGHGV